MAPAGLGCSGWSRGWGGHICRGFLGPGPCSSCAAQGWGLCRLGRSLCRSRAGHTRRVHMACAAQSRSHACLLCVLLRPCMLLHMCHVCHACCRTDALLLLSHVRPGMQARVRALGMCKAARTCVRVPCAGHSWDVWPISNSSQTDAMWPGGSSRPRLHDSLLRGGSGWIRRHPPL